MKRIRFFLILFSVMTVFMVGCGRKAINNEQETDRKEISRSKMKFVTSFYPIYVMMLNIADGISDVEVINMSENHTGCLHDFQIQPEDLKNIETSDAFVINGAGMEPFVDKIVRENSNVKIIDSSKGIDLMTSSFDHGHHENDGSHGNEEEYNPHIWVSLNNYIKQVDNIANEIMKIDPKNSAVYEANRDAYKSRLETLKKEMHEKIDNLPNKNIVTFHEAFPYFAKEFSLSVVGTISQNSHSTPSAKEISNVIDVVRNNNVKALFVEPQYPDNLAKNIADETGSKVFVLDPAVTGSDSKDQYIKIMEKNMQTLVEALS